MIQFPFLTICCNVKIACVVIKKISQSIFLFNSAKYSWLNSMTLVEEERSFSSLIQQNFKFE